MKFENFPKATALMDEIKTQHELLDSLSAPTLNIRICKNDYYSLLASIDVYGEENTKSPYGAIATEFVESMKETIKEKIETLEAELDEL